jgi:hypothetical protein
VTDVGSSEEISVKPLIGTCGVEKLASASRVAVKTLVFEPMKNTMSSVAGDEPDCTMGT